MLLTSARSLAASTASEIRRLKPATVYILGPESAIDATVAAKIAALGTKVVRVAATDRYAMASRVATIGVGLARARGVKVDTAYLVNGLDYPDAYVTSPLTIKTSRPILCASRETLPPRRSRRCRR